MGGLSLMLHVEPTSSLWNRPPPQGLSHRPACVNQSFLLGSEEVFLLGWLDWGCEMGGAQGHLSWLQERAICRGGSLDI